MPSFLDQLDYRAQSDLKRLHCLELARFDLELDYHVGNNALGVLSQEELASATAENFINGGTKHVFFHLLRHCP